MIDEVRMILIEGGAIEPIRIDRDVNGWLVSAFFGSVQHLGHTGISKETSDDPRDLARRLVAIATDYQSPAPSGVFDSGPALEEIREAYEDSYADDGHGGTLDSDPADIDPSGDIGELVEAGSDADSGGDSVDGGDYSAEPLAGDTEPGDEHQTEDVSPANLGGVLIQGDALATAKAMALMTVDDERFARVGDYDKAANQAKLDELRAIQQAIREGVHPPFTDEQAAELQALETFLPFIQRIDDHAQGLRNAIRDAADLEQLTAIDLLNGWPE